MAAEDAPARGSPSDWDPGRTRARLAAGVQVRICGFILQTPYVRGRRTVGLLSQILSRKHDGRSSSPSRYVGGATSGEPNRPSLRDTLDALPDLRNVEMPEEGSRLAHQGSRPAQRNSRGSGPLDGS